jgi:hypothetical protein
MIIRTLSDAKSIIDSKEQLSIEESFDLSMFCVSQLKISEKEHIGREIAIRVLDNVVKFPRATISLWNDVVEMSGLYPYVEPDLLTPSAMIRYEYHKSDNLKNIYLHEEQQEIFLQLKFGNSVILSAPTSFGKSLLIEEIIANQLFKNIVIIQPTLALLDETRKKLAKYKGIYNIIVSTSQLPKDNIGNIFLFTGERVVEYQKFPKIDFFVIDEFYKLSMDRDDDRAVTLNQAFHKLLKSTKKFYLLGPVVKSIPIAFQEKLNIALRHTSFATVAIDEIPLIGKKKEKTDDKEIRLFELLKDLVEPTLIYCSAPEKSMNVARKFASYYNSKKSAKISIANQDIIEWIDENIGNKWCLIDCLKAGVAFHNGILPRHLGSSIVDAFNSGEIKYLFCTATLIEGVNTTAKNIVLFDNTKGNKTPIDFFDYKNIAGRSGRMKQHYTGRIYKFFDTPPQLELEVDIPFVTQTNAPDELLIQLEPDELNTASVARMEKFQNIDSDLMEVIKSNNGISIEGQLALVRELESDLAGYNRKLRWSGYPTYQQLLPVLELAWTHFLKKNESKANVRSFSQLATYTIQFSIYKNVIGIIQGQNNADYWIKQYPDEQERINKITFNILNASRHWFDYKLPKWLASISKLQNYVFVKHGLSPGDYNAFRSAIENNFLFTELTTLLEYDVPMSAINKLARIFKRDEPLENILRLLRRVDLEQTALNSYEMKKLKQII